MENKPDLILSIYPDPSKIDHELNYSTQIVRNNTYYPDHLQKLINEIYVSTSPILIEQAIDAFQNYVSDKKKELIRQYQFFIKRENINQRSVYIIVDENNTPILKKDTKEFVYVAGPIGGGTQTFDHDLTEAMPAKWNYLIEFDDHDVAIVIESVKISFDGGNEVDELIIYDDINHDLGVQNLPFKIGKHSISLQQAAAYFEQQYQQTSTLNDFSPLIDSSFTAAEAILQANLIYLFDFPSILRQKMNQYGILQTHRPNFLTIQDIKIETRNNDKIKIIGYSFTSAGKSYSFINRSLFKGLKLFFLAENNINVIYLLCDTLASSTELSHILSDFEGKNQTLGTRGVINQFYGRKSESLREIIGVDKLQSRLDLMGNPRTEIPVGFVNLTKTSDSLFYETNFSELELPNEYLPALENFIQPLDLLSTGPLKLLKYSVEEISVHLEIENYRFRISKNHDTDSFYDQIIIYFNLETPSELSRIFRKTPNRYSAQYLDKISDYINQNNFDTIIDEMIKTFEIRTGELRGDEYKKIYSIKRPVTLYTDRVLSDHVVEIALKRILKEISEWEDGIKDSRSLTKILSDIEIQDRYNIQQLNDLKKVEMKETDLQRRMEKLNQDMDEFNDGFYNFVVNSITREISSYGGDISNLFNLTNNIFQDVKVAIIDFGLSAKDWAYADNLQLWNSYLAQVRYREDALILKLSDFLGVIYNGEEMEYLTEYPHVKNMVFTSFNGTIQGYNYVTLKKAYLYILPKLEKYKEKLQTASSLLEIIGLLESMEQDSREKLRASLPKLPTIKANRRC